MNLGTIPHKELAKYLNQIDLYNLILVNKILFQNYQSYLDKIKTFCSTRANCLSIYDFLNDNYEYHVVYNFRNGTTDLIPPEEISLKYYESDLQTITHVMKKVPLKEGDLIKFRAVKNVISKNKSFGFEGLDKYNYSSYMLLNGSLVIIPYTIFGYTFCISKASCSIYHWIDLFRILLIKIPYVVQSHADKYIEIDSGDFYYRVKCIGILPKEKDYLDNELIVRYRGEKCSISSIL